MRAQKIVKRFVNHKNGERVVQIAEIRAILGGFVPL